MVMENFEYQYATSLENILKDGIKKPNRTGIDTYAIQHQYFLLEDILTNFPILKGKKMYPKMALKEISWMMLGRTDVAWLNNQGVNYWNDWANKEGTIGKSYGYQYRNFNGEDNLMNLINELINNPTSRRLLLNIWNPADLNEMTLPPCVMNYQFSCEPSLGLSHVYYVDLHVLQRSADSFIGVPYDFMLAAWFLQVISTFASNKGDHYAFIPRDIHYTCNDYHMYDNHIDQVKEYLGNVYQNTDNIINQQMMTDIPWPDTAHTTFDEFLNNHASDKFKRFMVHKSYTDVYGNIKAPIAV